MFHAFGKIVKTEGFRGLYKGFGTNALNVITGNFYITVYEWTRKLYLEKVENGARYVNVVSGGVASIVSQTIVVPLDIVSQRLMMEGQGMKPRAYMHASSTTSVGKICKKIYATQGILGFYRGYAVSIATHTPSSAIWWGVYGHVHPLLYARLDNQQQSKSTLMVAQAISGGLAGVTAAIVTNPMDVIRTRTQIYANYSAFANAKYLLRKDGPKGLMRGVLPVRIASLYPKSNLRICMYSVQWQWDLQACW